jgi:trehalose 6-phosphate phosphatase
MPLLLADHLDRLAAEVRAGPRVLACMDFDGTLVPIRDRPEQCHLDPGVRRVLAELARSAGIRVGIVSGRELTDLRARVGVPGVAYAGNHGLEIDAPRAVFRHPVAASRRPSLERVVHDLRAALADFAGAWVEDKGMSASVHFRQVRSSLLPAVRATVDRVALPTVESGEFVLRSGKSVLEVRPAVDWNKGSAVHWLAAHTFPSGGAETIIYIGDDDTDEDAFREIGEGIGVCVGTRPATAAKYFVPESRDVGLLLDWLVTVAREREKSSGFVKILDGQGG